MLAMTVELQDKRYLKRENGKRNAIWDIMIEM